MPSLPRSLITTSFYHKACLVCRYVYILAFWFPFHKTDTESLHSPSLFPSLLSSPLFSLPLCSHSSPLFYIALLYSLFPSLSLSPSALSLSTPNVQESQ